MWYKIFMLVMVPALIIGWIAYAWWIRKVEEEEKNKPKPESQRLTKTKTEISDWAQKMAAYKPPKFKKYDDDEDEDESEDDTPSKPENT